MAVFNRLSDSEIEDSFTHYALFANILPIYFAPDGEDAEGCRIQERNWIPTPLLSLTVAVFQFFLWTCTLVSDEFEPAFPITITGEIQAKN